MHSLQLRYVICSKLRLRKLFAQRTVAVGILWVLIAVVGGGAVAFLLKFILGTRRDPMGLNGANCKIFIGLVFVIGHFCFLVRTTNRVR